MSSEEALSRSTKAAVTKLFLLPTDISVLRWAWGISPRSTSPSGSERTLASVRRWLASRARIVLEELNARLPSLRLIPEQTLRFQPNTTFRGPLSLLVEWDI